MPSYCSRKRTQPKSLQVETLEQRLLLASGPVAFVDRDGDVASIKLKGPGAIVMVDANGNGTRELLVTATEAGSSKMAISVKKGATGDAMVALDAITGSGLKGLSADRVDIVGQGINLAGTAAQSTSITVHVVGDGVAIDVGSAIKNLTVAAFGNGAVAAPNISSLAVKGDKRRGIAGDFGADITLGGQGVALGKPALGTVKIAGTASGIAVDVAGGIGSFTVGRLVSSTIFAGYTPNDVTEPLHGGSFAAESRLKSFKATGIKGSTGRAFVSSTIASGNVGSVTLASVVRDNADQLFGILTGSSIKSVTLSRPVFRFKNSTATPQGVADFQVLRHVPVPIITGFSPDSGVLDDRVTNARSLTIIGTAEPGSTVTVFSNGTSQGTTTVAADGSWTFPIPQQPTGVFDVTIRATAQDAMGDRSVPSSNLIATIDTEPPSVPDFDLDPASDTDVIGDLQTKLASATLVGRADANVSVYLDPTGATASAQATGQFAFMGVPLALGPNPFTVRTLDAAGNESRFTRTIMRVVSDRDPPVILARLANDTAPDGGTNADGLTFDPAIAGTVTDASRVVSLHAGLDAMPVDSFFDVFGDLQLDSSFSFDRARLEQILGGPLADGPHALHLQAGDELGHVSSFFDVFFTLDTAAPAAVIDSPTAGPVSNSNITVSGHVLVATSAGVRLDGQIDAGSLFAVAFDATSGNFQFDTALRTDGSEDGTHTVRVQAGDQAGNVSSFFTVFFRLDTTPPIVSGFDLSSGSDDGMAGDRQTTAARVTLLGQTEPNTLVTLVESGESTTANNLGKFQFSNIALAMGSNEFTVRATDATGNASQSSWTVARLAGQGAADEVIGWNQITLQAIRLGATTPPVASRNLAMVHGAVYDAVNAIEGTGGFYVTVSAPESASVHAAAAAAAHRVLSHLYPAQAASFDAALAASLAAVVDDTARTDGVAVGQAVADAIIALRSDDGSAAFVEYRPGSEPGDWQPTTPMFDVALLPQWASLVPFAMTSPSQFRPDGPPDLNSAEYAADFNQVKDLGRADSSTRTTVQTQIARFWADGLGTYTSPGHWNQIAEEVAVAQGNSLAANARLFVMLNVALADAAVVAWDAKYVHEFWRPVAAIRQADRDGNAATVADTSWTSLLVTPPFPEYVSGHSTFSGAADAILSSFFGSNVAFSTTSLGLPGVPRSFPSFTEAADEAGMSRIYGGIHFLSADLDGLAAGRSLGNYVTQLFAGVDTQAPRITVTSPEPDAVVNHSVTLAGRVTDTVSGVASVLAQVDGKSFFSVAFDMASGTFALPLSLALDGSAAGRHQVRLQANDHAGNVSSFFDVFFTLDTEAPTLTLGSPAANTDLSADSPLAGTADATGSTIVQLCYAFDDGSPIPIFFDRTTGAFDQRLDLAGLSTGAHVLTVEGMDAAGNTSSVSVDVNLPERVPLTITEFSPLSGASDVGATFRPKVTFSRSIDPTTLNSNNFYATSSTGSRLAATIVPATDASFAWLFFQDPMPGAATITITVDGSTIMAPDGALLDAADTGTLGSTLSFQFSTVSLANLPGTSLSGILADPGPDLKPGTFDDVQAGPDGVLMTGDDVYLLPIAGVKVFVLGQEAQFVDTDAAGRFRFDSVPAGNVKLALDGMTATGVPAGIYFPEMVMDLVIEAAQANTAMGSMGSREAAAAMESIQGVYLPRLKTSILQTVSNTAVTTIGVDAESAPDLTAEQRQILSIQIQPGSLVGPDGQMLTSGQVGISTVPPELVRDMLPPGVLQHTFDITVQAPGISNFSTPAPMSFPNIFNAAPGSQLEFLSFDHTTGRLVIEGTATVSADGQSVHTDPGTGITHPGWHGLTPPGLQVGFGKNRTGGCPRPKIDPKPEAGDTVVRTTEPIPMISGQSGGNFSQLFRAPPAVPGRPKPAAREKCLPPAAGSRDPELFVDIDVDGPLASFMKVPASLTGGLELTTNTFSLQAGQQGTVIFAGEAKTYDELFGPAGFQRLTRDQLYGSKITVTEIEVKPNGSREFRIKTYLVYRWVDVIDAVVAQFHEGTTAAFHRTLADGAMGFVREKKVDLFLPEEAPTSFEGSDVQFSYGGNSFHIGRDTAVWTFDPISASGVDSMTGLHAPHKDTVKIFADTTEVGKLTATGTATAPTIISIDTEGFKAKLRSVMGDLVDIMGVTYPYSNTFPDTADAGAAFLREFPNPVGNPPPDLRLQTIASDVLAEVGQDFDRVNSGPGAGRGYNIIGELAPLRTDITVTWQKEVVSTRGNGQIYGQSNYLASEDDNDMAGARGALKALILNPDISDAAKEWSLAEYLNQSPSNGVVVAVGIHVKANNTGSSFAKFVANTVAHELAHTFSINEGYFDDSSGQTQNLFPNDLMRSGDRDDPDLTFGSDNQMLLRAAVGAHPNGDRTLQNALTFYKSGFNTPNDPPTIRDQLGEEGRVPALLVVRADMELQAETASLLDAVAADGPGGATGSIELVISNPGQLPLTIDSVSLADGSRGFAIVDPALAGTTLAPGETATLSVDFDPLEVGTFEDTLTIKSNAGLSPSYALVLRSTAFPEATTARLTLLDNNNLGGVPVTTGSVQVAELARITNDGAQPLVLSSIQLADGSGPFSLLGVPADLTANPVTLAHGESVDFGVIFDPDRLGLARGVIEVATNDPANPVVRLSAVGTGLDDEPVYPSLQNDFIAIEFPRFGGSTTLRTVSDNSGNWELFLPPEQFYHEVIFDPETGLIAHGFGTTSRSGQEFDIIGSLVFDASTAPDTDFDGLADDAEFAIGTSSNNADTDGDGLDDFAEIQQGLDPLGGRAFPTGVIAALPLQGEAQEIVVEASTVDSQNQTAYVATGSYGLAIVDASQFNKPIVLSQLDLSGNNTDVSIDRANNVAAVAGGAEGLHLVDVSNPMQPVLRQTIVLAGSAQHVEVFDGVAYVASGSSLVSIEMRTGEILQRLNLGGSSLTDLARERTRLFTLDGNQTIRAVDVGVQMTARGALTLPSAAGRLFVGNDIAYVANPGGAGGFSTVNVANPDSLTLISGPDTSFPSDIAAGTAIVATGSSQGVLIGTAPGTSTPTLAVMNVSNPANTNIFLTRFDLPAAPNSVALASGIAFLASGAAGLQIVNYLSFDAGGQPPAVTISTSVSDADPATPAVQVFEGRTIPIRIDAADDVQVRSVELLLNGTVIRNDVSFPFDFSAIAPTITPQSQTVTLQVRATDTGGNTTLSDTLALELRPDTVAPTIVRLDPVDGARRAQGLRTVRAIFSEPLATASVTNSTFQLLDGSGNPIMAPDVQLRGENRVVQLTFDELAPGSYQFVIHAPAVTDRAGNPLGTSDVVSQFTVIQITTQWIGATSGAWSNANNWSGGVVPGPSDDVLIGAQGANYTVTLDIDATVASLALESENATVSAVGRTFTVSGSATLSDGSVFFQDSTWAGAGTLTNEASMLTRGKSAISSPFFQNGSLVIQSITTGSGANLNATLTVASGFTNAGTIALQGNSDRDPSTVLVVTNGTLTNSATGEIASPPGRSGRTIAASLINFGTISVNQSITFSRVDGIYANHGTFTIAQGQTLSIGGSNQAFSQNAGTLTVNGAFNVSSATFGLNGGTLNSPGSLSLSSGTFNFNGGAATGTPFLLSNSALNFGPGSTGAGRFTVRGTSSLSGDIATDQLVVVQGITTGSGANFNATLTAANGFTNAGTIALDGDSDRFPSSTLVVTSGTLTNTVTGVIASNGGRSGRTIAASLTNFGTVTLNQSTTLARVDGVYANHGAFTIASGQTLSIGGSNQVFNQNAGTLNLTGAFNVSSATFGLNGGTFNSPGNFNLSNGTFNFNGGAATGTPFLLADSALNFGPGSTGAGRFTVRGTTSLSGDIATDQFVVVQGITTGSGANFNATLTAANGFTNAGSIALDGDSDRFPSSTLVVTNGTLTNAATGVIISNPGRGGRTIGAELNNSGTVHINQSVSLGRSGAQHINTGTVNNNGVGITITGATLTNAPGGVMAGTGTFNVSGVSFTNSGTINPGGSPGVLTFAGNYAQSASGTVNVEISGATAGTEYDRLSITGAATLGGTLNIVLVNGFLSSAGDNFIVITAASRTGTFATITGQDIGNGLVFHPTYNPANVTLTVASALVAAGGALDRDGQTELLTTVLLQPIVAEAIARWTAAGADAQFLDRLSNLEIRVVNLPGAYLGWTYGNIIFIDQDAAGYGWFVDATPADDDEFANSFFDGELEAIPGGPATGKMDLLTVLAHEIGHALGLEHALDHDLMAETLLAGIRRRSKSDAH